MAIHQLSYDGMALRDGEPYLNIFFYDSGLVYVMAHPTLEEAIVMAPIANSISELAKVEEIAEGVPVRRTLAVVVDGVWLITDTTKELTMAKLKASTDAADVLLGVRKPKAKELLEIEAGRKALKEARAKLAALKNGKAPLKVAPKLAPKGAPKMAAKAAAPKAPRAPRKSDLFQDGQRIKKIGDRNTRPDSNVGRVISMLKPNMTVAEFSKALVKSQIPFKPHGILSFLVKSEVVQVK